ncbi:MAG: DUF554 domain-containing protein [Bacteroidales bacterium]|nr:DUF554 domain-containing protein [Bacteroidales bacterium]
MTGTLINVAAVLVGSIIGVLIHSKLPKKFITIVFQAIGLFTLFLGFSMALKTSNLILVVLSLVLGSVIGELIGIEKSINKFSDYLKKKIHVKNEKFSEGFTTAFLLYCMGSMTILGAIEEGLGDAPNLLLVKSIMDGIASIALASALGIGVAFSVIPLLIYQGGLTLFADSVGDFFSNVIIDELTAVGGILLIGLGISILEIKKLRILNMIPALVIIVILVYLF